MLLPLISPFSITLQDYNMSKASAYFEGIDGWFNGIRNPYPIDTEEWQSWERGWHDENLRRECQSDAECY